METNDGWLVVLDIYECRITFDLTAYGESTFNQIVIHSIPPGLHRLGEGCIAYPSLPVWFTLTPGQVAGFRFNEAQDCLEPLSAETLADYKRRILNGETFEKIKAYTRHRDVGNKDRWWAWQKITQHLSMGNLPLTIQADEAPKPPLHLPLQAQREWYVNQPSRFERTLFEIHQGDSNAFLAELEYVFIQQHRNYSDTQAIKRWEFLLQALYNAGERGIAKAPDLFISVIDLLIVQFDLTPGAKLKPGYEIIPELFQRLSIDLVTGVEYLVEDMIDSGIKGVVEKGHEFGAYLRQRGILPE